MKDVFWLFHIIINEWMNLFADKLYVDIIQKINKSESQRCSTYE